MNKIGRLLGAIKVCGFVIIITYNNVTMIYLRKIYN